MRRPTFQIDAIGYSLTRSGPDCWRVTSPSGRAYLVEPQSGSCTCPDSAMRGHRRACKHLKGLWAILKLIPDLTASCGVLCGDRSLARSPTPAMAHSPG